MYSRDKELPNLIDETLTPENSEEKGYLYAGEVIYQQDAPYEAMSDIIEMVENEGVKLGKSGYNDSKGETCGVYRPTKK